MSHFLGYVRLSSNESNAAPSLHRLELALKASFKDFKSTDREGVAEPFDVDDKVMNSKKGGEKPSFAWISDTSTHLESFYNGHCDMFFSWMPNPSFPNSNRFELFEEEDLVYMGRVRIDNREELCAELDSDSEGVDALSDAQWITRAYRKWGTDCVKHLVGDFSFCIWDSGKKKVLLAKDHLGIRPLFYSLQRGVLYFSSSITVLKEVLPDKPTISEDYILKEAGNSFNHNVVDTFFNEIKRLAPAHLIYTGRDENDVHPQRYWELTPRKLSPLLSENDFKAEFLRLFNQSIECRTKRYSVAGCQLSGGMDSSAISVLLSRMRDPASIHTYSFVLNEYTSSYADNPVDEQGTQKLILESTALLTSNHHLIDKFHFSDVYDELRFRNRIMGGAANSDTVWQASMFKKGSTDGVEVMLSGFPGDECASHPGGIYWMDYVMNGNLFGIFSHIRLFGFRGVKGMIRYFLSALFPRSFNVLYKARKKRTFLKESYDSKIDAAAMPTFSESISSFKMQMAALVTRPHTCLRTESEGAYANEFGMETSYPMADIRLLEFVVSLPSKLFAPIPINRALFRTYMRDILPDEVRLQPKFSGAKTLAFADYWVKSKAEELRDYHPMDPMDLFLSKEELEAKEAESEFKRTKRLLNLKELDFMIVENLKRGFGNPRPLLSPSRD